MIVPRNYRVVPIEGGGVAFNIGALSCGAIPGQVLVKLNDSRGKFLGYKVDSFWSLDRESGKPHTLEDTLPSKAIAQNLLYLLNDGELAGGAGGWESCNAEELKGAEFDERGTLRVILVDALSKRELCGYTVKKNDQGKYDFALS